jgi:hypothetical protein
MIVAYYAADREALLSCLSSPEKLAVAEPGHFHATLLQKEMYPGIEPPRERLRAALCLSLPVEALAKREPERFAL